MNEVRVYDAPGVGNGRAATREGVSMGEVNGRVTQTALAIRDEDELEVAASLLDAALRRAKAEGRQEAQDLLEEAYQVMSLWFKYFNSDIRPVDEWTEVAERVNDWLPRARDARAAQIEEVEHGQT